MTDDMPEDAIDIRGNDPALGYRSIGEEFRQRPRRSRG